MREEELAERPYRGLRPFLRMVAAASEGARILELDGVLASVVPVTPDQSVTNSVAFDDPRALERALDSLAKAYAGAGVCAWTVWVPERDTATQRLLEGAGHALDATPAAMTLELAGFERRPSPDLDLTHDPSAGEIGAVNDAAYGFDGDFSRAFAKRPDDLRLYGARLDGQVVACVGAVHEHGDCGIYLVATLPEARGRGLARDLMTVALTEARAAGCETASLQSTPMGKRVYAELGFRDFGAIQMWERRATSTAGSGPQ